LTLAHQGCFKVQGFRYPKPFFNLEELSPHAKSGHDCKTTLSRNAKLKSNRR
jgi:hypothetical protein